MESSIKLEMLSFVIVSILLLFHHDSNNKHNKKYKIFNTCLWMTAISIGLDLFTWILIENVAKYSIVVHMIVHSLYFLSIHSCVAIIGYYIFYVLFEHMREQKCYGTAYKIITIMWIILNVLVIVNIWTGCYFYIEGNRYCRGPINKLGFGAMAVEVAMLCMCYAKNKKVITPYAVQLVRSIPVLTILMSVVQFSMPDILLTGTIAAMIDLIVYACFQNNRIGRDALTELFNRPSFFREVNYRIEKKKEAHIVLVHLQNLDKINKRYGIRQGDGLLYNVARYLENMSSDYHVYRFGNTHFVMLGDYKTEREAKRFANKVFDRFRNTWNLNEVELKQQIQLVHMKLQPEEINEQLLTEQMRYLLSCSKDKNESTIVYFDEEIKAAYERKRYVLNEVKNAIQNESFVLYFQPIYSCKEERFITAEVLLRLFTEDGTLISPGEFIPLAEENGLSDEITWLVLKKSMEFVARHPEIPLESISVNMSLQQMNEEYLTHKILYAKENYGSHLGKLRIEITERMILQYPEMAMKVMKELVDQGMRFYLDDFGVGYSNFARIFKLPFEVIKLDRSLLLGIDENEKTYQMIKSLVELFHNAGFLVVAEGLETATQVEKAKEIGVDRIQGFFFARAMGEEQLIEFLRKH